jgi:endoglucanase
MAYFEMGIHSGAEHRVAHAIRGYVLACGALSTLACGDDPSLPQQLGSAHQNLVAAAAPLPYRGVNLAGAEFAVDPWGAGAIPGTHGIDYVYPDPKYAPGYNSAEYFLAKGMNTFRLPFRWERLQPVRGAAFDAAERTRLVTTVADLTVRGAYVIVDPHNYARYGSNVLGDGTLTNDDFFSLWWLLASEFKDNPRVIFGLMNEPHDMPTEDWIDAANFALSAIRQVGATNLVLVPGNGYTGAETWTGGTYGWSNAEAVAYLNDPGNNYAFEVHQYMDADSSGASDTCVSATIGAERLAPFTSWLHSQGKRGFLGEVGGGDNPTCVAAVSGALAHLEQNADVYLGWTSWAAGPWWGTNRSLEPNGSVDKAQMDGLEAYLQCASDSDCTSGYACQANHCAAKSANGVACTAAAGCRSNYCSDGVCCDQACTGVCQACTAAKVGVGTDGVCAPIAAGHDPDSECPSGEQCSAGACLAASQSTAHCDALTCPDAGGMTLTSTPAEPPANELNNGEEVAAKPSGGCSMIAGQRSARGPVLAALAALMAAAISARRRRQSVRDRLGA